jgi:hypothetical protein
MKTESITYPILATFLILTLSGCELIGGIFRAGIWVGVIAVAAVVLVAFFIARAMRR